MKVPEFLKRRQRRQKANEKESGKESKEGGKEKDRPSSDEDHSLEAQAKERAKHPEHLNVGTPFDWEELEAYQKELDRLEREGPGGHPEKRDKSGNKGRK